MFPTLDAPKGTPPFGIIRHQSLPHLIDFIRALLVPYARQHEGHLGLSCFGLPFWDLPLAESP